MTLNTLIRQYPITALWIVLGLILWVGVILK